MRILETIDLVWFSYCGHKIIIPIMAIVLVKLINFLL